MKIRVDNFQSIGSAELQPTGLTVIVGPSDRGKSALLRAIEAALFNRPGDQFVRTGAKTATVALELDDPNTTVSSRRHINWEKGAGLNKFAVDGVEFTRVGKGAPPPLQALGFRDVTIGAKLKDDGTFEGGETVRPQVARQFDPVFLLDKSGGFLNEVLLGLSRLNVLQRAGRLCAADLRAAKMARKVTQEQATRAREAADALAAVPAIAARLDALEARLQVAHRAHVHANGLRALLIERTARRQMVERRPVPSDLAKTMLVGLAGDILMHEALSLMVPVRQSLLAATMGARPAQTKVRKGVGELMRRRAALAPLVIEQRQHRNWRDDALWQTNRRHSEVSAMTSQVQELQRYLKICPTCGKAF